MKTNLCLFISLVIVCGLIQLPKRVSGTTVLLPQTIFGGQSSYFDSIENDYVEIYYQGEYYYNPPAFGISDAGFIYGASDAFDTAYVVSLDNRYLYVPSGLVNRVHDFIDVDFELDDIDVNYELYVSTTKAVARLFLTFTNTGEDPFETDVLIQTNSGADSQFTIEESYSGDLEFDTSDYWVIISDSDNGYYQPSDPVVTYSIFGPDATETPEEVYTTVFDSSTTNGIGSLFTISLTPGEKKSLIFFVSLYNTVEEAKADANLFSNKDLLFESDLLFGLTSAQLARTVNFGLTRNAKGIHGICDFASEIKDRVSRSKTNKRHPFSQPWQC